MGLLDKLIGMDNMLGDRDIASDMLKDSKFAVISLAKAVSNATNPAWREFLQNELLTSIMRHQQLAGLAAEKDWYKPFLAPQDQVSDDFEATQGL